MKKMKIVFEPDNKIDNSSHRIIEELYGIKGALLTNLSSLYDFEDLLDEIPGHKLIRFMNVPPKERKLYKRGYLSKPERLLVWYPPLSKEEKDELQEAYRKSVINRLEKFCKISFKDYPNDKFYVWEVAEFITRKKSAIKFTVCS